MRFITVAVLEMALLGAVSSSHARVQNPNEPATALAAPKAPFVAPVPARGRWKITVTEEKQTAAEAPSASASATSPALPTSLEVTKVDDLKRVVVTLPGGIVQTYDHRKSYVLTAVNGQWRVITYRADSPPYPFCSEQFPLTEWISADRFKGRVILDGVACHLYEDGGGSSVWIDARTLLPVAAQQGNCRLSYEFLPLPAAPIKFSAEEAAVIYQLDHPPQPAP